MEMHCSNCGALLENGEPHCSKDQTEMTCEGDMCTCPSCGNMVKMSEVKCDECLGM